MSSFINENGLDASALVNSADALVNDVAEETSAIGLNPEAEAQAIVKNITKVQSDSASQSNSLTLSYSLDQQTMQTAWDPRLYRIDAFVLNKNASQTDLEGEAANAQIPFGSHTVNSAFYDYTWNIEQGVIDARTLNDEAASSAASNASESTSNNVKLQSSSSSKRLNSAKVMVNDIKEFQNDSNMYAPASLMNAFTLTKLVGGLNVNIGGKKIDNYMFDIRDQRRFYDMSNSSRKEDIHATSCPTVSLLINWSNSDRWGRTPYTYQDFVFTEWFGKIPNNRLITLRRYHAPTYDNLNFEQMFGDIESDGKITTPNSAGKGVFSPIATVVTYFGGDTGNSLSSLMNFTTGTKWKTITSDIFKVDGDEGENPQAKIDNMLEGKPWDADQSKVNSALGFLGNVSGRVVSFGKLAMAMKKPVGIDETLQLKLYSVQNDPYDGVFKNRVQGPLNRIDSVEARDKGIEFSQSFLIICSYKAKAIGGLNPKAALLDVLGNCLTMASPTAVFWGGGYRFMVKPHAYPFHDGGWRDNFMKKLYDGNILGNDGAIANLAQGIKNAGTDENGLFSFDSITSKLGNLFGDGLAFIGAAVNSVTSMFGGDGNIGDFLIDAGTSGKSEEEKDAAKKKAKDSVTQLFSNVEALWHNRVLKESTLPQLSTTGAILTGQPVGEWHLTIGNPLNPIMVVGNLICKKMVVNWDEELGPDDFPTGFKVTYTVEHGMARDNDAIQSMFNRGMGKFYVLPDYIQFSSDRMTAVDNFTQDGSSGDTGSYNYMTPNLMKNTMSAGGIPTRGYNSVYISPGTTPSNVPQNPNTQLLTKFTPLTSGSEESLELKRGNAFSGLKKANLSVISSKLATRKLI